MSSMPASLISSRRCVCVIVGQSAGSVVGGTSALPVAWVNPRAEHHGVMAPSVGMSRSFVGDYDGVFNAACWAAVESGMTLHHADRVAGVISLTTAGSFASWGERVGVRLGQGASGCVQVSARSELKFGLVDWGTNAKNLDRLFRQMDAFLGSPAQ